MSQTIGELFLNLGVKGDNTAFKALTTIKNALTDMSAQGIAAKASIIGAIYALEQFSGQSGAFGAGMKNFAMLTGESTTRVQQLAEAIREVTAARRPEAIAESQGFIENFQTKIAGWHMRGTPIGEFANTFAAETGYDLNNTDFTKFFAAIQKFRKTGGRDNLGMAEQNSILNGMGISKAVIETASSDKIGDITKITKNIESDQLLGNLKHMEGQWSDFWTHLERIRDQHAAKLSSPILTFLNTELDGLEKKLRSIEEWSDKHHPVNWWDKNVRDKYLFPPQVWIQGKIDEATNKLRSDFKLEKQNTADRAAWLKNPNETPEETRLRRMRAEWPYVMQHAPIPATSPSQGTPSRAIGGKQTSIKVDVHQHGVKDTFDGMEQHRNEVARAYYQIATSGQVA